MRFSQLTGAFYTIEKVTATFFYDSMLALACDYIPIEYRYGLSSTGIEDIIYYTTRGHK